MGKDGVFLPVWIIKQIWQSYSVENTMGNDKYIFLENAFAILYSIIFYYTYIYIYVYILYSIYMLCCVFLAKKRVPYNISFE